MRAWVREIVFQLQHASVADTSSAVASAEVALWGMQAAGAQLTTLGYALHYSTLHGANTAWCKHSVSC